MKYLLLLTILFAYGCGEEKEEVSRQAGKDYGADSLHCCEFDRHVIRKNEKWVCRVIFCNNKVDNGGPTTLFCDKE